MSLLTLVQRAVEEIGEFGVPETVVGNTSPTAVQMLRLATQEGRMLARRHAWQQLVREYTLTTVAAQEAYVLPSDFRYALDQSHWDRSNNRALTGPVSPQVWQTLKANPSSRITRTFRIRGGALLLHPTPTASGETLAFEYVSTHWCESAGGVGQGEWVADTDVARLDEELMGQGLVWRFLRSKGLPYEEEYAEYETQVRTAIARDGGGAVLSLASAPAFALNIPETGVGQ